MCSPREKGVNRFVLRPLVPYQASVRISPATRNNIYRGLRHYCLAFFLIAIPMSEIVARSPTAHPVVARTFLESILSNLCPN